MFGLGKDKDKDKDKLQNADINSEQGDTDDGDKTQHGPDVVGGVPTALSDVLKTVRGEVGKDFEMVEVDDDGKVKLDDDGNPIVITDASDEEIADAKDGDTNSGDTKDSSGATDDDGTVAEADTDPSVGETELDPRLLEAGKKMGWTEEKIISIAQTDMSILTDLADRFDKTDTQHRQDETSEDAEDGDTGLSDAKIAKLREKFGDDVADIMVEQAKQNAELKKKLGDVEAFTEKTKSDAKQQAEVRRYEIASELFDNNAKNFPEFGTSDTLPKDGDGELILDSAPMKVREAVFNTAKMFQAATGSNFSSAMNDALAWHAGRSGKVHAQREVIKDLNNRKQRFSPRPSRRKMVKVFKTPEAKGAAIVAAAKKQAGIT